MSDIRTFCSIGAVLIGVTALVGGWLGAPALMTWHPEGVWVTQKTLTSLMVISAGLVCFFMADVKHRETVNWATLITLGIVAYAAMEHVNNRLIPTDETMTVGPNMPSLGTLAAFGLISLAGLLRAAMHWNRLPAIMTFIAALIGVSAIGGYMWNAPAAYFWIPGYSTAMALPTAVSIVLMCISVRGGKP